VFIHPFGVCVIIIAWCGKGSHADQFNKCGGTDRVCCDHAPTEKAPTITNTKGGMIQCEGVNNKVAFRGICLEPAQCKGMYRYRRVGWV
jgi:hypothetical protein